MLGAKKTSYAWIKIQSVCKQPALPTVHPTKVFPPERRVDLKHRRLLPCVHANCAMFRRRTMRHDIRMIYESPRRSGRVPNASLLPLVRTDNLRVHARKMVVDVVLLWVGVALRLLAHGHTVNMNARTHWCIHTLPQSLLQLCAALSSRCLAGRCPTSCSLVSNNVPRSSSILLLASSASLSAIVDQYNTQRRVPRTQN